MSFSQIVVCHVRARRFVAALCCLSTLLILHTGSAKAMAVAQSLDAATIRVAEAQIVAQASPVSGRCPPPPRPLQSTPYRECRLSWIGKSL